MEFFIPFPPRKQTKEALGQTSSDITESLMSMSRMMAQQVEHSQDTMTTLGQLVSADGIMQLIWEEPQRYQLQVMFHCIILNFGLNTLRT